MSKKTHFLSKKKVKNEKKWLFFQKVNFFFWNFEKKSHELFRPLFEISKNEKILKISEKNLQRRQWRLKKPNFWWKKICRDPMKKFLGKKSAKTLVFSEILKNPKKWLFYKKSCFLSHFLYKKELKNS